MKKIWRRPDELPLETLCKREKRFENYFMHCDEWKYPIGLLMGGGLMCAAFFAGSFLLAGIAAAAGVGTTFCAEQAGWLALNRRDALRRERNAREEAARQAAPAPPLPAPPPPEPDLHLAFHEGVTRSIGVRKITLKYRAPAAPP